jgi:hypothetical protein
MTVNVTNTVGANNTIVLDGSSKIPAFDGSLVTALSATAFTTGTLAIARIDVGTGANQILQLDVNAKLPALSATNLTNVPGPTVSTSDPAIDTNSTLGKKWINKTSGEVYICTDATAGENVWTNVGAGTGDIKLQFQGESYGFACGGMNASGKQTDIERFSLTSDGDSSDVGDLSVARMGCGGATDVTTSYGYMQGGSTSTYVTTIDRFAMVSGGAASSVGDTTLGRYAYGASSSSTHGYYHGGEISGGYTNTIDRFAYGSTSDSTDVGDLTVTGGEVGGGTSEFYGYAVGGYLRETVIDKYSFASGTQNAADVGDLSVGRSGANGVSSSSTYIYLGGGYAGGSSNVIDKVAIASDGDATDVGNLTQVRYHPAGTSSTTYGYCSGGRNPYYNVIDKFSFSTDGDATDVGNLTRTVGYQGTCQY